MTHEPESRDTLREMAEEIVDAILNWGEDEETHEEKVERILREQMGEGSPLNQSGPTEASVDIQEPSPDPAKMPSHSGRQRLPEEARYPDSRPDPPNVVADYLDHGVDPTVKPDPPQAPSAEVAGLVNAARAKKFDGHTFLHSGEHVIRLIDDYAQRKVDEAVKNARVIARLMGDKEGYETGRREAIKECKKEALVVKAKANKLAEAALDADDNEQCDIWQHRTGACMDVIDRLDALLRDHKESAERNEYCPKAFQSGYRKAVEECRPYMGHGQHCVPGPCECGLDALLHESKETKS